MDRNPDGVEQAARHPDPGPEAETHVLLAEYSALQTEIERRAQVQWNVFALQVTTAGAIASLAIASASRFSLLLLVPLSSYMLGSRYILHDFNIKLTQRYIRDSLSPRLSNRLQWYDWRSTMLTDIKDRWWFRATGWFVHPTRLAFEGVAALALVTAALLAVYRWRTQELNWPMAGFLLLWMMGTALAFALDRLFDRSSHT
jgi:hypothetical protein